MDQKKLRTWTLLEVFNAVAGDMKLEKTIQRFQRNTGGMIGQTRQSLNMSPNGRFRQKISQYIQPSSKISC